MITHLHWAHKLGPHELRGVVTAVTLCGVKVSRKEVSSFIADVNCPTCTARAEGRPLETNKLFVYGTLKRNHGNNRLLTTSEFIGEAISTDASYRMLDAGVPYLLESGEHKVRGELFALADDDALEVIDRLEGHPYHYHRVARTFTTADGTTHLAWVYLRTSQQLGKLKRVKPDRDGVLNWYSS